MIAKQLKDVLKQINEPNTFQLEAYDLSNVTYWVFVAKGVRIKDLVSSYKSIRTSRFDVFINNVYIPETNYVYKQDKNLYIKFLKANIPYDVFYYDTVVVTGDVEQI